MNIRDDFWSEASIRVLAVHYPDVSKENRAGLQEILDEIRISAEAMIVPDAEPEEGEAGVMAKALDALERAERLCHNTGTKKRRLRLQLWPRRKCVKLNCQVGSLMKQS